MSSVPYTFANSIGNIPLAYLDANFSNVKAYANTAGTVTTAAQPNITSVGTLTSLTVTGNVTAANFIGNISGNISNAVYATSADTAGTVTTAAQPNITSVGTLTVLTVSGNIRSISGAFVGSAAGLTSIPGANVTGTVANATYATSSGTSGTVTTAAQPNITSVGTLSSLTVTGNITSSSGVIIGNASGLTNLTGANVTGTVANATYATTAGTVTTAAQPNITSVGTLSSLTVTGNITSSTGNIKFGASGNGILYTDNSGFSVLGTTDPTNGSYILGDAGNVLVGAHPTYGALITTESSISDLSNSRALTWNSGTLDLDLFGVAPGNIANVGTITASNKVVTTPVALASLTATAGARAFINNGNLIASGNFGAQVSGSGANTVPVWSDGTNWYIG